MSPCLHQIGADRAHGTVVGGEGFVKLSHVPADGRLGLRQVDLEASLSQVQRSLHSGDATPYHQHPADRVTLSLAIEHRYSSVSQSR